jgi:hypothetical protein
MVNGSAMKISLSCRLLRTANGCAPQPPALFEMLVTGKLPGDMALDCLAYDIRNAWVKRLRHDEIIA